MLLRICQVSGEAFAKALITTYRYAVSPLLPPSCRYLPTCSEYAWEAVEQHGLIRGLALSMWRLLRCHPFGGHGYDPVPKGKAGQKTDKAKPT